MKDGDAEWQKKAMPQKAKDEDEDEPKKRSLLRR
jgi:hypothetical protein